MQKRLSLTAAVAVITVLGIAGPSLANVIPGLDQVVLLATDEIRIEEGATIASGSAVVNDSGGKIEIKKDVTTAAGYDLKADEVKIEATAVVGSDVHYNSLDNSGTITGALFTPLSLPVFAELPDFFTGPSDGPDVKSR